LPADRIRIGRSVVLSIDADTVRRIAELARIAVAEEEIEHLRGELNAILTFVEQLSGVDVNGVEPVTSVVPMQLKKRKDEVTDGQIPDQVLRNAPATDDNFFLVPKVVE
jgi:aspartyl-tRNA(Asn)/glutamyl-tRNA(Gln) amidotransferase subunit C